jgi:hypothetical protein
LENIDFYNFFLINPRLQPTYDIDPGQLRRNFLLLQQRVHPDSYSTKEDRVSKIFFLKN